MRMLQLEEGRENSLEKVEEFVSKDIQGKSRITEDYCIHFNSVDKFDKLLQEIRCTVKINNWKLKELTYLLSCLTVNSWVVYEDNVFDKPDKKKLTEYAIYCWERMISE